MNKKSPGDRIRKSRVALRMTYDTCVWLKGMKGLDDEGEAFLLAAYT